MESWVRPRGFDEADEEAPCVQVDAAVVFVVLVVVAFGIHDTDDLRGWAGPDLASRLVAHTT
jgi:hypothetical protein